MLRAIPKILLPARKSSMKVCCIACSLLLFTFVASPALLLAQFQKPTDEDLKMTSDPKAPGADAVYLNVEEVAKMGEESQSFYRRIKILTEKGKDLATVELPYFKHVDRVKDIKGRTIQPNGTIIPLEGKPEDILQTKTSGARSGRKVFTLPDVRVGSIIEYYFEVHIGNGYIFHPVWEIQQDYFVHHAHYVCVLCGFQGRWTLLPKGVDFGSDNMGNMTLDLVDIPPAPKEEWMPPIEGTLYKVVFYSSGTGSADEFWSREGAEWSKSADEFVAPSKSFRETVNGLTSPGDSDLDKAKKLYKAVQSLDNTEFSREKSESEREQLKLKEIKRAEDVWTQKSGTRTEIALLYLSMLRAAGLTAYAMRAVDREFGIFAVNYLNYDQLDDTLVILSLNGKETVLDPGEKMCPFGTVHWKHSSTTGLRQGPTGSGLGTTPPQPYGNNTTQRIADLTLDSQGGVEGNIRFLMSGQEALFWRQKALENDESEVKKQFDDWIKGMVPDGVDIHIDHFVGLDDPDVNLIAFCKAQGMDGAATSKRLIVPGLFFETHGSHPFVNEEKRLTPVDMHYGEQISDEVVYHLPAGLAVESAPQTTKVPWEGHAVLLVKSEAGPGEVTVTRTLARAFTFAKAEEYQSLRDFYQKVAAADQQQLLLTNAPAATPAPAAKGN
jgi:hypothetical protein